MMTWALICLTKKPFVKVANDIVGEFLNIADMSLKPIEHLY